MQRNIIHLMSDHKGNSQFCFPESPDVSRDEVEGNIRTRGKTKLTGFPRDLTLPVVPFRICALLIDCFHKKRTNKCQTRRGQFLTPPDFILLTDFTLSQLSTSRFVPGERKPSHFPKFYLLNTETPLIWTPSMAFSVASVRINEV